MCLSIVRIDKYSIAFLNKNENPSDKFLSSSNEIDFPMEVCYIPDKI